MKKFGSIGPALKAGGWDVIPVRSKSKAPDVSGWQHGFSLERVRAFAANGYAGGNTGLLARQFPGLDIDVADATVVAAIQALAASLLGPAPVRVGSAPKVLMMYATSAPFPKVKVFLTGPNGDKGPDGKDYAVEVLGDGQQYIIYGTHPAGHDYQWPGQDGPGDVDLWDLSYITAADVQRFIDALPGALPPGWSVRSSGTAVAAIAGGADPFETLRAPLDGWDLDRVAAEVMPHLDLEMHYDDWIRVGQALYHQFDGSEEAFELWDSVFAASSKYGGPEYGESRWRSFKAQRAVGRGPVTLASLLAQTKEAREAAAHEAAVDSVASHRAAIEAATGEAAVREVAQRIALDSSVDALARDLLVGAIQTRLRAITGVKPTVAAVRAMVALRRERTPREGGGGPEWVEPWVYVTGQTKFFNRTTKELITREAFDAAFNRFMEPDDEGVVQPASRAACDGWQIPVVWGTMYLPGVGDLFALDGREFANLYRPSSVPTGVWDAACSAVLQRHVDLLIPDAMYRKWFLQWAAWVVRNPGKKVLWAVFVKGVEGDGKSTLGNMIARAMGPENVGLVSPETLAGSAFNDWAVGRCVNVIEELKMQGHNRHDVYNKIKPLITNSRIEVHGKGRASMTAVNTTNYIGFSNHADALPLDDHDRRQFVLFTPFREIGELHAAVAALGLTMDAYWRQLWDVIDNRPDAVRGFFDAVDIGDFDPNSRAPATVFKDEVVAAGDLDDAEAIAKFHIQDGAHGVSSTVLSSACLTKVLAEREVPITLHTTRVRKLLEGMGFKQIPRLLKWKGDPHRVWVRTTGPGANSALLVASPAELRAFLDRTVVTNDEDFLK